MEIRKHRLGVEDADLDDLLEVEDEIMDDAEIEVASDYVEDEEFMEDVIWKKGNRGKRAIDDDEDGDEADSNSDEGDAADDNEDNESASVPTKKRSRKEQKKLKEKLKKNKKKRDSS